MATTVKHTPGPWTVVEKEVAYGEHRGVRFLRIGTPKDSRGGNIGVAEVRRQTGDLETDRANAALIAAAPDLLALAKAVASFAAAHPWTGLGDSGGYGPDLPAMARAAVAKAEGR